MEVEKPIEVRAVEALGSGFDLTFDFRLRFMKECANDGARERLVVLDDSRERDVVVPSCCGAGGVVICGVSEDIRCDKGEMLRFKSDVIEFNQVCALLAGGGYLEKVAVPVGQVLPIPPGISLKDTASFPKVACTVWSRVIMLHKLKA